MARKERKESTSPISGRKAPKTSSLPAQINGEPSHDDIARRAYELYLNRGSEPGRDLDDWLRAESDLKRTA